MDDALSEQLLHIGRYPENLTLGTPFPVGLRVTRDCKLRWSEIFREFGSGRRLRAARLRRLTHVGLRQQNRYFLREARISAARCSSLAIKTP